MAVHAKSGHPDWYVEALTERYQYLVDELARQKSKGRLGVDGMLLCASVAVLAYFAFGNIWAAVLFCVLIAHTRYSEQSQKRYQLATQMLTIEAEFPYVRENVALPTGERA